MLHILINDNISVSSTAIQFWNSYARQQPTITQPGWVIHNACVEQVAEHVTHDNWSLWLHWDRLYTVKYPIAVIYGATRCGKMATGCILRLVKRGCDIGMSFATTRHVALHWHTNSIAGRAFGHARAHIIGRTYGPHQRDRPSVMGLIVCSTRPNPPPTLTQDLGARTLAMSGPILL